MINAQRDDLKSALAFAEGVRAFLQSIMRQFDCQMTVNQVIVLLRICLDHVHDVKCTVRSIVESEAISQQTVSGCVLRLEARGYVEPLRCQEDGRVRYLRLSEKGMALSEAALGETLNNGMLGIRRIDGRVPDELSGA